MNDAILKRDFAERLNLICDEKKLPPADGRGRQPELARLFGVNTKAARKWLMGEGFPEMAMIIRICNWADVNIDWLLRGKGPKRGAVIETRILALGEVFNQLSPQDRREVLNLIQFKLHQSKAVFASEDSVLDRLHHAWEGPHQRHPN